MQIASPLITSPDLDQHQIRRKQKEDLEQLIKAAD